MTHHNLALNKIKLPWLAMAEALMLLGGLMVLLGSVFFNWVSYTWVQDGKSLVQSYKGLDFGRKILPQYIEVWFIPALGVLTMLAALFSAGRRRSPNPVAMKGFSTALRAFVLIMGIMTMILAFEIVYRYNPTMTDATGLTFWENARIGWYMTIYGGLLIIFGAGMSFGKNLRKVGFINYWLITNPLPEEPPVPPMLPQFQPMMPMPPVQHLFGPAAPPPPNAQPMKPGPCPSCGKPLEFIPEYQALYCYACNKYP